ncbi:ATP-dependent helicase [Klebsiella pneumoniae]|uniref:UvrD-helicase domain-containing protein n=1 Tax=Klebsiella pneumoniae TaxID=573 RepID=UPI0011ED459B|nr:ATP-dependent helicase [Klebsiella pneumoniae]MBM6473857.1 ATP-dependent helicase [Klebsiella pneumoniae]TZE84652.1 ATP-dependent helicase [Klebsiella pneumoniae]
MTSQWLPSEGIEPTQELMDIIFCDQSVSVLAGAGAGKTELLAQKSNYLLQTGKCMWPKRILCLSYKKEAQENIKTRVMKRCGQRGERFDSYTFDAFCKSIVDRFKDVLPENKRPLNNYDLVFNQKANNGKDKISFDLIRSLALDILTIRTDIVDLFSLTYSHVFIDEFQDTRSDQYEMIKLLFKDKGTQLLAVGDINQSIMLWAGAKKTVFEDCEKEFNTTKKLLVHNFRASEEIQEVLRCFIHFVQNDANFTPIIKSIDNCTIHYYDNELSEADDIADKIARFITSGIEEKEICVLVKQQSEQYTEKLRDKLTTKGIRNLDLSELQDVLKEPLGQIFAALFKVYTSRSSSSYTELCDLYLELHRVSRGDEKEDALIKVLSDNIAENKKNLGDEPSPDSLITCIKDIITLFGVKRMVGRWNQYKSADYWDKIWRNLEQHLRYTIDATHSLNEAALMFQAENSVQVMNVHKCKGLEYKVVIFLGLEDQAFWAYKNAKFENDCALYVALSRAKESIIITSTKCREHRITNWRDDRTSTYKNIGPIYSLLTKHCKFREVR